MKKLIPMGKLEPTRMGLCVPSVKTRGGEPNEVRGWRRLDRMATDEGHATETPVG